MLNLLPALLFGLGLVLSVGRRTASVDDIYANGDPVRALAAVKAKWPEAGDRLSEWKRPSFSKEYFELEEDMNWCTEDIQARCEQAEAIALDAIGLKIDPPRWYYNLACAKALQGKREEAFTALEQAVAAGIGRAAADHARRDSDLVSLTTDVRFARLCAMMEAYERSPRTAPPETARLQDGRLFLTERNVHYDFAASAYEVNLETDEECPVLYLNHLSEGPAVADGCVVPLVFPEEAGEPAVAAGPGNVYVRNLRTADEDGECEAFPVIVASDWLGGVDGLNRASGVPPHLALTKGEGWRETRMIMRNVIDVFAMGTEFSRDGVDRMMGHYPMAIAHEGGAEESVRFVELIARLIRAMPKGDRCRAAYVIPWLLRQSQGCVVDAGSYLSGQAHRPLLRYSQINVEKALKLAERLSSAVEIYAPPIIDADRSRILSDEQLVTDLWDSPYSDLIAAHSPWHIAFMPRFAAKTTVVDLEIRKAPGARIVWRLLQGSAERVRFEPRTNGAMRVSVDYHEPFLASSGDGRELKTSRVDVGVFKVEGCETSMPSIVSFYFMPNERRVYGENGLLESIDYRQRQYETWCPRLCPKGDWKDVFHWTAEGELLGWTRTYDDDETHTTTNEFTRDGLVIDTRDELGRPKDVHRSLRSTWIQNLEPTNLVSDVLLRELPLFGKRHDEDGREPEITTLAWIYGYEDASDRFGQPHTKAVKSFSYRPDLCRRADLTDASTGFRLSVIDQMELGYDVYAGYRHDLVFESIADLKRSDSVYALGDDGLVPPKELRKMRFCPFESRTNDAWRIDTTAYEVRMIEELVSLADGSYRARVSGEDGEEPTFLSVADSHWRMNMIADRAAYGLLDAEFRRCSAARIREVTNGYLDDRVLRAACFVEGDRPAELPEDKAFALTMWEIRPDLFLLEHAWPGMPKGGRSYVFIRYAPEEGRGLSYDAFRDVPSYATGNTVLRAMEGEPEALNNFAVLFYEGLANPGYYDEDAVVTLLERAADAGCGMAKYNLGVLYYNCGETEESDRWFEEARDSGVGTCRGGP